MPALRTLRDALPLAMDARGLAVERPTGFARLSSVPLWSLWHLPFDTGASRRLRGGLPEAVLEGFRWRHRSVVLIALRDQSEGNPFLSAFLQRSNERAIARSVSVFSGGQFASTSLGGAAYYVGTLSPWGQMNWFYAEVPWLLVPSVAMLCLFCATALRAMLRRRARRRIQNLV